MALLPIEQCSFCGKDGCRDHMKAYWEDSCVQDYPDFFACWDCSEKANKCEYIAEQIIGRHESWKDVVDEIFNNFEEYAFLLGGYRFDFNHYQ